MVNNMEPEVCYICGGTGAFQCTSCQQYVCSKHWYYSNALQCIKCHETYSKESPVQTKDFSNIQKKVNKAIWAGLIAGGFIGFLIAPSFWAIVIGMFIGGIMSRIAFGLFASEETKKELAEYGKYKEKEIALEKQKQHSESSSYLSNIECPTCHSKTVRKISTSKKFAYVAGFGILAPAFKKVRSQFECKNCGYKW
jgi:hypothetical protein